MIAGMIKPSSGEIKFKGTTLNFEDLHYRTQHIRMVFQDVNSAFNPRQNIGQILDTPLRLTTDWDEETRNQKFLKPFEWWDFIPIIRI
ncbi:peptide transport system ATP-binding protein SapF [Rodentibacter pneumotropicus]|uniref:Peptide transport system ATP-binding protein SapF n=1 Tax=Rodentibacter pneumotropicus TaxID=758 RepID=A0A3S4U138_9PAST|nr:peptide transport system ATP-binding protein SapF [Rodentibacter pneumotropicus]